MENENGNGKKSRGPIIDPWGTPQFKGVALER